MGKIVAKIDEWLAGFPKSHSAGVFPSGVLDKIEDLVGDNLTQTAETGCGKSSILFSNLSKQHHIFALDDAELEDASSVNFYRKSPLTRLNSIEEHLGASQKTLPGFKHSDTPYDCVLIDGAHGWPFPELEYYFFYPNIKKFGFLILDDVNIPTIGRMADILIEDDMWELSDLIQGTAVFQRTSFPTFDPYGDGWWAQKYNRSRVSRKRDIHLRNKANNDKISELKLDDKVHGVTNDIITPT
jgi:hypothetical protein